MRKIQKTSSASLNPAPPQPVVVTAPVSPQEIQEFFVFTEDLQAKVKAFFQGLQVIDEKVTICDHTVAATDSVLQAVHDLQTFTIQPPEFPEFTLSEVINSKYHDPSEGFTVLSQGVTATLESVAWVAFCVQQALHNRSGVDTVKLNAVSFKTIFDGCQVLEVTQKHMQFYYLTRFTEALKRDAEREAQRVQRELQIQRQIEDNQKQKEEFVQSVRDMVYEKEHGEKVSAIAKFANDSQTPYLTQTLFQTQGYTGAPKYLKQRQRPLEIPFECIYKLVDAIDTSFDERCDLWEIKEYVAKKQLPITDEVVQAMFTDAQKGRGFLSKEQMRGPLTHKEIAAAVKGRHKWNTLTKEWEIEYQPFRDYWIVLLLSVQPKIFALPTKPVVPQRIKAQFELEEELSKKTKSKSRHLGMSITQIYQSSFQRDPTKQEAGIHPEQSVRYKKQRPVSTSLNESAFQAQVNQRIKADSTPRVSFNAKEMFAEVNNLCAKVPTWSTESKNPINFFVPDSEQAFQPREDQLKIKKEQERLQRFQQIKKEKPLQLAVTQSLNDRKLSPLSKLKETRGIVTLKNVPDNFEVAKKLAQVEYPLAQYEYKPTQEYVFRETDPDLVLKFGQIDMQLRTAPPPLENPGHCSVYDRLPRFWSDRERYLQEKLETKQGLEGTQTWQQYHKKLPLGHVPLAHTLPDKLVRKEPCTELAKDKWEPAMTLLTRHINDSQVVGKPQIIKYFKAQKPSDRDYEFDGSYKKFNVI